MADRAYQREVPILLDQGATWALSVTLVGGDLWLPAGDARIGAAIKPLASDSDADAVWTMPERDTTQNLGTPPEGSSDTAGAEVVQVGVADTEQIQPGYYILQVWIDDQPSSGSNPTRRYFSAQQGLEVQDTLRGG